MEETDTIYACALSADGKSLIFTCGIGLAVWDIPTRTERFTAYGHPGILLGCALSPDERFMLSASVDESIKGWLTTQETDIFILLGHTGNVNCCTITKAGDRIVSASDDRTLKIWSIPPINNTRLPNEEEFVFGQVHCAIAPSGKWAISLTENGEMIRWNLGQTIERIVLTNNAHNAVGCLVDSSEAWIATSSKAGITLWDPLTGASLQIFKEDTTSLTCCALSPDGTWLVTASEDRHLRIWDRETGQVRHILASHTEAVTSCSISSDGKWIASASHDQTLKIWDTQTGNLYQTLQGHTGDILYCAFMPTSNSVLSASERTIMLWDFTKTQLPLYNFTLPDKINRCAISPDGKFLLVIPHARPLQLWDIVTGQCITTFYTRQPLYDCAFHSDGKHIIVAAENGIYLFLLFP